KKEFDYILVDSPAGIEHGFKTASVAADQAIVVCTPDVSSIRDADRVIGLLQSQGLNTYLLINRISPELVEKGDMLSKDDVLDILGVDLIGIVPKDERILISSNSGVPVVLDEDSEAGKAFMRIAARIDGEEVEIIEPKLKKEGFFAKLGRIFGFAPEQ
ncbi:MAG: septum site-determining protein MinD, partial [Nitrospirae bacterium]